MTAVECLIQQLRNGKELNDNLIQQAKEMEKEQIKDAFNIEIYEGEDDNFRNAEQYYNETFKSK
jgi:hypothetical protein